MILLRILEIYWKFLSQLFVNFVKLFMFFLPLCSCFRRMRLAFLRNNNFIFEFRYSLKKPFLWFLILLLHLIYINDPISLLLFEVLDYHLQLRYFSQQLGLHFRIIITLLFCLCGEISPVEKSCLCCFVSLYNIGRWRTYWWLQITLQLSSYCLNLNFRFGGRLILEFDRLHFYW